MGLDTSHDCWHGSYTAFHRWRCYLAQVAGLPDYNALIENKVPLGASPWAEFQRLAPRPLFLLLHHSDCDGEIPVEEQLLLAECLEGLAEMMPDGAGAGGHIIPGMKQVTLRFAAGLRRALAAGEPVDFH